MVHATSGNQMYSMHQADVYSREKPGVPQMLKILFGNKFAVLLAHTELYETKLREAQKTSVPKISLLLSSIRRAKIGVENIY